MTGPSFSLPVRVYYEDTDAAGIVYYANYLRFLERARSEWLRSLGFDHAGMLAEHGAAFVVASLSIDYLVPARLDDRLEVGVTLIGARRASFDLEQPVTRGADTLCRSRVRIACVDVARHAARRIPEAVITELERDHRSVTA